MKLKFLLIIFILLTISSVSALPCMDSTHCNAGDMCGSDYICIPNTCSSPSDCAWDLPFCDTTTNTCVKEQPPQCIDHDGQDYYLKHYVEIGTNTYWDLCSDDMPNYLAEKICVNNDVKVDLYNCADEGKICQDGRCICTSSAGCSSPIPVCDTPAGYCVECLTNSDCSNPTPYCEPQSKKCFPCTLDIDCTIAPNLFCDTGNCVTPTAPAIDCSILTFTCSDYNDFVDECNTDFCKDELPGFSRYDNPPDSDPLYPCYYSELDIECKLCSSTNLVGCVEGICPCSAYDNNETCTTYPCELLGAGPCIWEGDLDTGVCVDDLSFSTGAQDTVTGDTCNWVREGSFGDCINGVSTLDGQWVLETGTLDGCPEPSSTKSCLVAKKFPFSSSTGIITALVLLTGYYIILNKRKKQQPL